MKYINKLWFFLHYYNNEWSGLIIFCGCLAFRVLVGSFTALGRLGCCLFHRRFYGSFHVLVRSIAFWWDYPLILLGLCFSYRDWDRRLIFCSFTFVSIGWSDIWAWYLVMLCSWSYWKIKSAGLCLFCCRFVPLVLPVFLISWLMRKWFLDIQRQWMSLVYS